MTGRDLNAKMRDDWNARAKDDAHFYVAFGQLNQSSETFLDSGKEVLPSLLAELSRLDTEKPGPRRSLEIGCGPGRLLLSIRPYFDEVYGVDISDEMINLARSKLLGDPAIKLYHTTGSDLSMFADDFFDFVYSYVVFQHIPSREIVMSYVREAKRVLKPGGVLRCQFRGVKPVESELVKESSTWIGCYFDEKDINLMAEEFAFPLVAISGINTQYLWSTFVKPPRRLEEKAQSTPTIKDVTAASSAGKTVSASGPDAAVSLWLTGIPAGLGLSDLPVLFDGKQHCGCFLSKIDDFGGAQLNARLPLGVRPGPLNVGLLIKERELPETFQVDVKPPAQRSPRVLRVRDGINLVSTDEIQTRSVKVSIEAIEKPETVHFMIEGLEVIELSCECIDPISPTHEFTFRLPDEVGTGAMMLSVVVPNFPRHVHRINVV